MTSIMWPARSRTSQPVQRVWTFQFFGSSTSSRNFFRSRRRVSRTVSFPSALIGLTGAITALISTSPPCGSAAGRFAHLALAHQRRHHFADEADLLLVHLMAEA